MNLNERKMIIRTKEIAEIKKEILRKNMII